jgi:hypothetical protein
MPIYDELKPHQKRQIRPDCYLAEFEIEREAVPILQMTLDQIISAYPDMAAEIVFDKTDPYPSFVFRSAAIFSAFTDICCDALTNAGHIFNIRPKLVAMIEPHLMKEIRVTAKRIGYKHSTLAAGDFNLAETRRRAAIFHATP